MISKTPFSTHRFSTRALSFFVKLLNKAFDVNEMNFMKNGISPFFQSAIIVYLFYRPFFDASGNPNTRLSDGRASLNLEFERNVRLETIDFLIQKGADFIVENHFGIRSRLSVVTK